MRIKIAFSPDAVTDLLTRSLDIIKQNIKSVDDLKSFCIETTIDEKTLLPIIAAELPNIISDMEELKKFVKISKTGCRDHELSLLMSAKPEVVANCVENAVDFKTITIWMKNNYPLRGQVFGFLKDKLLDIFKTTTNLIMFVELVENDSYRDQYYQPSLLMLQLLISAGQAKTMTATEQQIQRLEKLLPAAKEKNDFLNILRSKPKLEASSPRLSANSLFPTGTLAGTQSAAPTSLPASIKPTGSCN